MNKTKSVQVFDPESNARKDKNPINFFKVEKNNINPRIHKNDKNRKNREPEKRKKKDDKEEPEKRKNRDDKEEHEKRKNMDDKEESESENHNITIKIFIVGNFLDDPEEQVRTIGKNNENIIYNKKNFMEYFNCEYIDSVITKEKCSIMNNSIYKNTATGDFLEGDIVNMSIYNFARFITVEVSESKYLGYIRLEDGRSLLTLRYVF